jgi:hypothetical protein
MKVVRDWQRLKAERLEAKAAPKGGPARGGTP